MMPAAAAVTGLLSLLYLWLGADAAISVTERVPIAENMPALTPVDGEAGAMKGELLKFDGVPADLPGIWPRFRGAHFDATSNEKVTLALKWPEGGPRVIWSVELGEGYAGAAVLSGRVYVVDYDQQKKGDAIRCLSLADGKEIWRYFYPVKVKRNHGMSRTVPAVTDRYLVAMGPKCHVTCLDSTTGELKWMLDLVKDFGAVVPQWYAGQCPLIDEDKAIIGVGGESLVMAVGCENGEVVWKTPNPHGWTMTHSSIVPVDFAGLRMYVYCASGGVAGISAADGQLLWEYTDWKINIANVPTPAVIGDGFIFLSGGYNAGSMMLKLIRTDNGMKAEPVFRLTSEVFGAPQHTPIFYQGHLYGVRQDEELVCLDLSGKVLWTSTSVHKFGLGPYTIVNGLLYIMNDSGVLTLVEATPSGYSQLAEAKVLEGPDSWGPMAVAGGRLIVRDLTRMVCLDITER
jgi:outer membrane protein assembly factor BamB